MSKKVGRRSIKPDFKIVDYNYAAQVEGPQRKKTWTKHDVKAVSPLTENQKTLFQMYYQGDHCIAFGSAGTGKTFLAINLGINDVISPDRDQDQLIIVRSAVPARDVGFMPGDLEEKTAYYESPYIDIMTELFGRPKTYEDMKEAGYIKFLTTSFIRGVTLDNAVVVVDEAQNMTWEELNTIMTRIGKNTRVFVCGDIKQDDLNKKASDVSGFGRFLATAQRIKGFSGVEFGHDDIVRSKFVKQWIIAAESTEGM